MGQFSMTISKVAGSVLGDNQHPRRYARTVRRRETLGCVKVLAISSSVRSSAGPSSQGASSRSKHRPTSAPVRLLISFSRWYKFTTQRSIIDYTLSWLATASTHRPSTQASPGRTDTHTLNVSHPPPANAGSHHPSARAPLIPTRSMPPPRVLVGLA